MVTGKVYGIQATGLSLNDRFTILATMVPTPAPMRPRRRPSMGAYFNQNHNFKNQNLIEQIARRLELQAKRQAVKHRLGMMRRFGSESNLADLRRSNSFGNLSQNSIKNRVSWRQSNGNLSRAASFGNLRGGAWRGFWIRGGSRPLRGRFRGAGGPQFMGRVTRSAMRGRRGRPMAFGGRGGRSGGLHGGRGQGAQARGRPRGRALPRGGRRTQNQKLVPSREELDLQLDQYMAGTKAALDKDLDTYMKNAMEQE